MVGLLKIFLPLIPEREKEGTLRATLNPAKDALRIITKIETMITKIDENDDKIHEHFVYAFIQIMKGNGKLINMLF